MIRLMDDQNQDNSQSQYDVFRRDSTIDLAVAEERPVGAEAVIPEEPPKPKRHFKPSKGQIIIVAVVLLFLLLTAAGLFLMMKNQSKAPETPTTVVINTQSLDNGTLNQLTPKADGTVEQQLTISPNTIFKNNVTVQGSTELAKNLSVGGSATVQGATTMRGNAVVGGSLTVGSGLTVNGLVTAGSLSVGSITISTINISGDLAFGGHIIPSGSQPSVRTSTAAGGGSASITGNDTAGTITITTGGSGTAAGEMAIVTFQKAFGSTPKVQLTPVNAAASNLRYFATKSSTFFTINSSTAPSAGTVYIFDYFVVQ